MNKTTLGLFILLLFFTLVIGDCQPASQFMQMHRGASEEKVSNSIQLDSFAKTIQNLVDVEEIVGAEALVVFQDKKLFHQGFGWKDREAGEKIKPGTIFNIRSMTKPMAATVVHMLKEQGKLKLTDKIAQYLPSFSNSKSRHITIEDMLLHRAGYEQGSPGKSWRQYSSLQAMADYWGQQGPSLPADGKWSYADAHADVLGAVVEQITGKNAGQVLEEAIFQPLQLKETYIGQTEDKELRDKTAIIYRGKQGDWNRLWSPMDQDPLYPFPMYAQSVFSSATDYAKFLQLWMNGGHWNGQSIISKVSIQSAFSNRQEIVIPPGFKVPVATGKALYYGHFWGFSLEKDAPFGTIPFVFTHHGSDGTAAYAFPHLQCIVIIMTQSRGMTVLPDIEEAIMQYIIHPINSSRDERDH